jgi:hypothetical protein
VTRSSDAGVNARLAGNAPRARNRSGTRPTTSGQRLPAERSRRIADGDPRSTKKTSWIRHRTRPPRGCPRPGGRGRKGAGMDSLPLTSNQTPGGNSVTIAPARIDSPRRASPSGEASLVPASRSDDAAARPNAARTHDEARGSARSEWTDPQYASLSLRWYSGPSECSGSGAAVFHGAGMPARRPAGASARGGSAGARARLTCLGAVWSATFASTQRSPHPFTPRVSAPHRREARVRSRPVDT